MNPFALTLLEFTVQTQVVFWDSSVDAGNGVDFQLTISSNEGSFAGYYLSFTSVQCRFTNLPTVIFNHLAGHITSATDVHEISDEASVFQQDLTWTERSSHKIFNGRFRASKVGKIELEEVKLISQADHHAWGLEVTITRPFGASPHAKQVPRWVRETDPDTGRLIYLPSEGLSNACQ